VLRHLVVAHDKHLSITILIVFANQAFVFVSLFVLLVDLFIRISRARRVLDKRVDDPVLRPVKTVSKVSPKEDEMERTHS
jgi:hypothetical protein